MAKMALKNFVAEATSHLWPGWQLPLLPPLPLLPLLLLPLFPLLPLLPPLPLLPCWLAAGCRGHEPSLAGLATPQGRVDCAMSRLCHESVSLLGKVGELCPQSPTLPGNLQGSF